MTFSLRQINVSILWEDCWALLLVHTCYGLLYIIMINLCVCLSIFFYVVPDILHVILESPPSVVFSVPWKVMYYISSGWMHKLICSPETYEKRKCTASRNALMHLCIHIYIYINLVSWILCFICCESVSLTRVYTIF